MHRPIDSPLCARRDAAELPQLLQDILGGRIGIAIQPFSLRGCLIVIARLGQPAGVALKVVALDAAHSVQEGQVLQLPQFVLQRKGHRR